MIENFLRRVAGLSCKYTIVNRELMCINKIKQSKWEDNAG